MALEAVAPATMDWPGMLRLAVERFGIAPDAFWRLSLVEWRALTAPLAGGAPLGRAGFEALAARFPDEAPGPVIPAEEPGPRPASSVIPAEEPGPRLAEDWARVANIPGSRIASRPG